MVGEPSASVEARGFQVVGRVQGVGFRWWTRAKARSAGLSGCVWNCDDGSVRVDVSGPSVQVDDFQAALHKGPPAALVRSVEAVPAERSTYEGDFEIVSIRRRV